MRLLLIRHGKAGDSDAWIKQGKDDALRPLTSEGKREMRAAAKGLRKIVDKIDALATSPLKRAVKTAEIVFAAYDDRPQFLEAPPLESGPPAKVVSWLRSHDLDHAEAIVALVGHEPYLSRWAGFFLTGKEKPLAKFKKGTVAVIDFPAALAPGRGVISGLHHPTDLKRM